MENEGLVILSAIAGLVVTLVLFTFVYFRGLILIGIFQSDKYDAKEFLKNVFKSRLFEKHATLIILLAYIGWAFMEFLAPNIATPVFLAFAVVALAIGAFRDQKVVSERGREANTVPRNNKILYVFLALTAAYFATVFSYDKEINILFLMFTFLIFFQAPPIFIIAANFIVRPFLKDKTS